MYAYQISPQRLEHKHRQWLRAEAKDRIELSVTTRHSETSSQATGDEQEYYKFCRLIH